MEKDSLGLIETLGLVGALEAADAGSKAANVTFRGYERGRAGLVTVVFTGDVAAVRAAVCAGAEAAKRVGHLVTTDVIARPDHQLHVTGDGSNPVEHETSPTRETAAPAKGPEVSVAGDAVRPTEQAAPEMARVAAESPRQERETAVAVAEAEESIAVAAEQPATDWAGAVPSGGNGDRATAKVNAPEEVLPAEEAMPPARKKEGARRTKARKKL